jgi:hypothetical protein
MQTSSVREQLAISLSFGLAVFGVGIGADLASMHSRYVSYWGLITISNGVMGMFATMLCFVVLSRAEERRRQLEEKLALTRSLNHHIRNELQVISSSLYLADAAALAAAGVAVQHIQDLLSEMAPIPMM